MDIIVLFVKNPLEISAKFGPFSDFGKASEMF